MSEVCQAKIHLLGKLQEKSLNAVKKTVTVTQLEEVKYYWSPRNNPYLKFGTLSQNASVKLYLFLSLDYTGEVLSCSSESEEEESREYNEAV